MKKLFVIALATAALASCSKVETIEPGHKSAIGFSKSFVDNTTKALIDNDNIEDFAVWGTENGKPIFDGTLVEKDNTTQGAEWGYTGTRYWHANSTYSFVAIAPYNENYSSTVEVVNGLPTTVTYTLVDGIGSQVDLLYTGNKTTTINAEMSNISPVEFAFTHALAKVQFSFTNDHVANCGYTVKISNLAIAAKNKATFDCNHGTWTFATDATNLPLTFAINGGNAIAEKTTVQSLESLIIPAAADTYTITGKAEIFFGGNVVKTINFNQKLGELKKGFHYNITATITSDKPIVFDVAFVDGFKTATPDTTLNQN